MPKASRRERAIDDSDLRLAARGLLVPAEAPEERVELLADRVRLEAVLLEAVLVLRVVLALAFALARQDLAVLVDENLPVAELVDETRAAAGTLLKDIIVFDIFAGKGIETGLKSVALGLILQETSRTLTESEIDGVMTAVVAEISAKFNASIRE